MNIHSFVLDLYFFMFFFTFCLALFSPAAREYNRMTQHQQTLHKILQFCGYTVF